MAALLAASSAMFASPRSAFATQTAAAPSSQATPTVVPAAPPSTPVGGATVATAPDKLAALLKANADHAKDVAQCVQAYVLDANAKFAVDAVRANAATTASIGTAVQAWASNAQTASSAAYLYFVLASGKDACAVPAWISQSSDPGLKFSSDKDLRACLTRSLTTERSRGAGSLAGSIHETTTADDAAKFLQQAGDSAKIFINEPNKCGDKLGTVASVAQNDRGVPPAPMAPGFGQTAAPAGGGTQTFGFNALYRDGAVVGDVSASAADGYRTLSLKLYPVVQPDGSVRTKLGVADISNPGNIYEPTYVDIPINGKTKIAVTGGLPDGTYITRNYEINYVNGQMVLSRPNSKPDGTSVSFSIPDLAQRRAEQASRQGVEMIDGKPCYILGVGGAGGRFSYFDKATVDNRAGGSWTSLVPVAVTDPVTVKGDLGWGNAAGKPNLIFADKTYTDKQWHLEWNKSTGRWEITAGPGDAPPAPPTPAAPPAGAPAGAAPTTPGAQACRATGADLNSIVTTLLGCGLVEYDGPSDRTGHNANADFDDATKKKVHLLSSKPGASGTASYILVFPDSEGVQGNQLAFGKDKFTGIRGFANFVVFETADAVEYLAYDKLHTQATYRAPTTPGGAAPAAPTVKYQYELHRADGFLHNFVAQTDGTEKDSPLPSNVALDILTNYGPGHGGTSGSATDAQTIITRINAYLSGRSGTVSGAFNKGENPPLIAWNGDAGREVWPQDKPFVLPSAGPAAATASGQGGVFDLAGVGGDEVSQPTTTVDNKTLQRKRSVPATGDKPDIALYQADGTNEWYFVMRLNMSSGVGRTGFTALTGGGKDWPNNFANCGMQGFPNLTPPLDINKPYNVQFIGTAQKGAYVLYRLNDGTAANNRDKPGNCAGAIMWCGMSAAEAQTACVQGKL